MVRLTQSLRHWLWEHHKDKIGLIMFEHTELITQEMWDEYIEWCKTEDGVEGPLAFTEKRKPVWKNR